MPPLRPLRRVLAFALAIALVPVTAGAVMAGYGKPTIALRASTSSVAYVDVLVNRNWKQIDSCSYVIDSDAPAGCGWLLASEHTSRYTLVPNDPSVGDHTVIVTVVLTDNEELSNSVSFTVAAP